MSVTISQYKNGYLITGMGESEIVISTDELFERLLQHFEGRYKSMTGDFYGTVTIQRVKP